MIVTVVVIVATPAAPPAVQCGDVGAVESRVVDLLRERYENKV